MKAPVRQNLSVSVRVVMLAATWLVLITVLHGYLNAQPQTSDKLVMGYMPVITNLAAPLVDAASKGGKMHFEALKFSSFAEMAEAFKSGHIQVAFIIAPLAIALHQQGVPLKLVYVGNRHESTLVVRKDAGLQGILDLQGKTVAVPIRYSGHLLALRRAMRERGLDEQAIRIVEIPPPDMPAALSTGGIDGYFVGEPFASKSIRNGMGIKLLDVEAIWPQFICNVMIVSEKLVQSHPEKVQALVSASVRSGLWAKEHIGEAVQLVARYWGQDPGIVQHAFTTPPDRVRFDLYVPVLSEFEEMDREMQRAGFSQGKANLTGMVEDRFARHVNKAPVNSFNEILKN